MIVVASASIGFLEMWTKLAAQRERKAKSSSSISGFSPSMAVPLQSISGSFECAVVSTIASSVDTCHVTCAVSSPIMLASLFTSPVPSVSGELSKKWEHSGYSTVSRDVSRIPLVLVFPSWLSSFM